VHTGFWRGDLEKRGRLEHLARREGNSRIDVKLVGKAGTGWICLPIVL
jgi:hypothetical protein